MSASAPQTATYPASARDKHSTAAAMWELMLSNVPTLLGRLVSVASFSAGSSGEYTHPKLGRILSPEVTSRVLRESHEQMFAEWVGLFVEEQAEDLQRYLASLPKECARDLLRKASESLVPASANPSARRAFVNDLEQILAAEGPAGNSWERSDLAEAAARA